ncbi:hypothetical protein F4703DRAFT_1893737 [Phycomyces blakesleeanus]
MGLPEIPFEILFNIAYFLTAKDKLSCMTVCSVWKEPFCESLWKTIHINDQRSLIPICNSVDEEKSTFKENGDRVRSLFLSRWLSTKAEQLQALQKHFQKIQLLHAPHGSIRATDHVKLTDWRLWNSLIHLEICVSGLSLQDEVQGLLDILSGLPNLERLEYIWTAWGTSDFYRLQDIEALHKYLPRLKYLSLSISLANLDPDELDKIELVEPAENLRVLKTRINNMDLRWLAYFARKYTKIHTLEWTDRTDLPASELFQEEAFEMFTKLHSAFKQLNKVVVNGVSQTNSTHIAFWNLFGRFGVPLKSLEYNLGTCFENSEFLEKTITACLQSCSSTLETLLINGSTGISNPTNIPVSIGVCPNLVSLDINVFPSSIAINIILDNCIALRKLKLEAKRVFIDSNIQSDIQKHDLQLIHIIKSRANSALFKYISERCRRLRYMRLVDVAVVGPLSQDTGTIFIDMSYTCLALLKLNHVSFYGSQDDICNNESAVNLIRFSTVNSPLLYDNTTKNRSIIIPNSSLPETSAETVWFHTYWDGEEVSYDWRNECKIGYMRVLSSEEKDRAQEYFKSFQFQSNQSLDQVQVNRSKEGLVVRNDWEYDLPRGQATLLFAQVNKYVINAKAVRKDNVWSRIYAKKL